MFSSYCDNADFVTNTEFEHLRLSCGAYGIKGITNVPEEMLHDMCLADYQEYLEVDYFNKSYLIWSDTVKGGKGKKLALYLTQNKLAKVISPGTSRNSNSGNRIDIWVAKVHKKNLIRWWKNQIKIRAKENEAA